MAVKSVVNLSTIKQTWRFDAEYWHPIHIENELLISRASQRHSVKRIYDLVERITGSAFYPSIAEQYTYTEGIPFIRVADLGNFFIKDEELVKIPEKLIRNIKQIATIREGDIVIAKGGSIGGACLVQPGLEKCAVSRDVIAIKTDEKKIDSLFLVAFLKSKVGQLQLDRYKSQQVQAHLTFPAVGNVRVVVPSRDLQNSVANLITEVLNQEKKSKALYAEAESLLLRELGLDSLDLSPQIAHTANFSEAMKARRLDAEYWEYQYTKLVDYLREIPHDSLAQLASFSNGATPRGAEYLDSGVPFLRIQNVSKNKLNLDDVVYIDEMTHNKLLGRSQLKPGDVLVTITGRIGTSAVVPKDLPIGNINQHIVRLRLKYLDIRPHYISTFLNSTFGHLQTEREAYGTTREALPYYCLERVIVPKASEDLQFKVEQKILEAERSLSECKILLEKAKYKVEKMILSEALENECPQ